MRPSCATIDLDALPEFGGGCLVGGYEARRETRQHGGQNYPEEQGAHHDRSHFARFAVVCDIWSAAEMMREFIS